MPMLDFRVETFLAVCRHMNFTKAARELNITQPAVSHHMHYLEQAYGTALFQHNGKRLQLTEAGEILRRTLLTMKHDEQHLQKRMQQAASGTRDYSFGATLSVAEFMINEALGRFLCLHPDSHIQMQVADTKVLLSKLDSGELDFAVVEGDFPKAEYDFFVFGTEEYVAAGDPEKAARYRGRPLTDLLGEPLLLREEGSGTRVILEYYLKEHGLAAADFAHTVEIGNIGAIKTLLKSGYGVSFLYRAAIRPEEAAGTLGVSYIKAVRGPLAYIDMSAVGGVKPENVAEFLDAGVCGFGVGGQLVLPDAVKTGDFAAIQARAKAFTDAIAQWEAAKCS